MGLLVDTILDVSKAILDQLIRDHLKKKSFSVLNLEVVEKERTLWVRILVDPDAFRKKMFDGEWANPQKHPELGKIRLLRVITGNDGITRVIGRQEQYLYAYPWKGNEEHFTGS